MSRTSKMHAIQAEDVTEVDNANCGCLEALFVPSLKANNWGLENCANKQPA